MKLWMAGEVQDDLVDAYRSARKEVESAVNSVLGIKSYGTGVNEWAYLAIILNGEIDERYPEISKYLKRKKGLEFRLKIDHAAFKETTDLSRRRLLFDSLVRSVEMMADLGVGDFDVAALKGDLLTIGATQGWRTVDS